MPFPELCRVGVPPLGSQGVVLCAYANFSDSTFPEDPFTKKPQVLGRSNL